jgi:predicted RNA-binding protein YlxR (DUF448 family)
VTRGGRRREREAGERRCITGRESLPRGGLIRFVIGPGDVVVPDLAERLPGRGIWVAAERAALETAVRKNLFARAAKRSVRVAPELVDAVADALAQRVVDAVALARKAGEAVAGREKVLDLLRRGRAVLLLQAADGSARERAELRPPDGAESRIDWLSAGELGMAFGRDRVIHAALTGGGLAEKVRAEAMRLRGFRSDAADGAAGRDATGEGPRDERLVENG